MDSSTAPQRTLGDSLDWLNNFLFYTDEVCKSVGEDQFDARFTDPGGGYFFSAKELMMHISDSRWDVISWIDGGDHKDRLFVREFGGHEKPWEFRPDVTKAQITESLAGGKAEIEKVLARPETDALTVTESLRESFEKRIAALKEKGQDTAEIEAKGPSNIANVLMFLAAHEQSHRGELQWLMRTRGADVFRYI